MASSNEIWGVDDDDDGDVVGGGDGCGGQTESILLTVDDHGMQTPFR